MSDDIRWVSGVPTVSTSGLPGYITVGWNALAVPAKTPATAVDVLNQEIAKALATPEVRAKYIALGLDTKASPPKQAQASYDEDLAKWRVVIEKARLEKQ